MNGRAEFLTRGRVSVAALVVSASTLVGLAIHEGYSEVAAPPVRGDVPTVGYGTTRHPDGTPVRAGERTTPTRALVRLAADAERHAQAVRRCAPVPLHQHEFDAYVSLTYNVGEARFCNSSIPAKLAAGDYTAACRTILEYVCGPATEATRARPGERCYSRDRRLRYLRGLDNRRQAEYRQCLGERREP